MSHLVTYWIVEIKVIHLSLDNIKTYSSAKIFSQNSGRTWDDLKSWVYFYFFEKLKHLNLKGLHGWGCVWFLHPIFINIFMNCCFCLISVEGSLGYFFEWKKRRAVIVACTVQNSFLFLTDSVVTRSISLQVVVSLRFSLRESRSMFHFKEK